MTNEKLQARLIAAGIAVVLILAISLAEYVANGPNNRTTFVGNNATLFALLFAAYLTYLFQQRGKFVDELRGWWYGIVEAKSEFFVYCDKASPSEEDYLKGFYALSTSMDTFRLIYCNVDRTKENPKGFFPFEQVRDIMDVAKSVAPSRNPTTADRANAKQATSLIFQSLRLAIQAEASASVPDNPTLFDSPYRKAYLKQIGQETHIDLAKVREANERADCSSSAEQR
jgi:hypothetical protein